MAARRRGSLFGPADRPSSLKGDIQETFRDLSTSRPRWGFNGSTIYEHVQIDPLTLLKGLIKASSNERKEFYVLDIGVGDFSWGNKVVKDINSAQDLPDDITVHVISITAEPYSLPPVAKIGRCIQYNFDKFKAEELTESFAARFKELDLPIDLDQKIDIAVSNFFFFHLHDPVGTFIQAYNLLRPKTGVILTEAFPVLYTEKNENAATFTTHLLQFLLDTKQPFLVQSRTNSWRTFLHFAM